MSWFVLRDIYGQYRDAVFRQKPYQSCPRDGEPLHIGPDGQPFCKFDGYRPGGAQDPGYGLVGP